MAQRSPAKGTESVPEVMTDRELNKAGQEVAQKQNIPNFDSADLANIETLDDLGALFERAGVEVSFAHSVLGDGFAILGKDDKMSLIGKGLALIEWRFNKGDMGEFVSVRAVDISQTPFRKVILNDGSTGIYRQLRDFTDKTGIQSGLMVKNGLRVSEYTYEDPNTGVERPAKTFYLDTSA